MSNRPGKSVSIAADRGSSHLSKGQKVFNTLIKQIEKKRTRLAAWEQVIPPYQRQYISDFMPLVDALAALRIKLVHCLDRAYGQTGLTKPERRTIANLIAELAGELAAARNDLEMKALYNQYSQSDFDREEAVDLNGMKSALEGVLGVELGDDDVGSPDDLLARAHAKIQERQTQFEADQQARESRRAQRTRSAKQIAYEAKQQAEDKQLSQSIRELYRKLASALHPDRETDPQERDRKTVLMQRVNQAYDKNNLLQLLELQLELEHIDQSALNNLSEDRLKHYNQILKDQLAELDLELDAVVGRFRAQFGLSPFDTVNPSTILRDLAEEIVSFQYANRDLERELVVFDDVKTIKAWLKQMKRQARMVDLDDGYF